MEPGREISRREAENPLLLFYTFSEARISCIKKFSRSARGERRVKYSIRPLILQRFSRRLRISSRQKNYIFAKTSIENSVAVWAVCCTCLALALDILCTNRDAVVRAGRVLLCINLRTPKSIPVVRRVYVTTCGPVQKIVNCGPDLYYLRPGTENS